LAAEILVIFITAVPVHALSGRILKELEKIPAGRSIETENATGRKGGKWRRTDSRTKGNRSNQ